MRAFLLILLLLSTLVAAPAGAQSKPKPRRPPSPAAKVEPVAPAPKPSAKPPALQSLRMTGLPAFSDAGAACRAQCSKDRYSCHGEDDATDCNGRWLTCLTTCRAR